MYPLVSGWASSGQSQQDFCQRHDLSVGTFAYWVGKYRREQAGNPKVAAPTFVPLVATEGESLCSSQIRLIYGDVRLEFGSGVGSAFVASLVQKLRD